MLRQCCVERLVMPRNALIFLLFARNAAQHDSTCRTKLQHAQAIDLLDKSLAIPAGLEPATRGVEIRYSIQLSYGTVRTGIGAGRLPTL